MHLDGEVKQIESVRVGDRVSECVKDPQGTGLVKARSREHRSESDDSGEEGSGDDDPDPAISFVDPEVWRLVTLVVTGEDGETTTVRWLRPVGWVEASRAVVGSVVRLEVGELGIDGVAMVKSIEPCPVIAAGNGPLVTCTFETTGQEVWAVEVEGEARAIRCTGGHLFYSMDRQRFVAAAELVDAELVWTVFGSRRIEKVAATGERTTVYNFEVSGVHRYLVGQVGVLVHNAGACPRPDPARPHYKGGLHEGKPVKDHVQARALGGSNRPGNIDVKPWEANARKGAREGQVARADRYYVERGLTADQARQVMEAERRWLRTDVHARPIDSDILDSLEWR